MAGQRSLHPVGGHREQNLRAVDPVNCFSVSQELREVIDAVLRPFEGDPVLVR